MLSGPDKELRCDGGAELSSYLWMRSSWKSPLAREDDLKDDSESLTFLLIGFPLGSVCLGMGD